MDIDLLKGNQNVNGAAPLNLKKYVNYILKRKYWILILAIIFSTVLGTVMPVYLDKKKKYTTTAVIRFDNPSFSRGISPVTDFTGGMETVSKASLFTSNTFIESVVDSLNLNFFIITPKVRRTELLKEIQMNPDVTYGKYIFRKEENRYSAYYEDPVTEEERFIARFQNLQSPTINFEYHGFKLVLDTEELKKSPEIEFILASVLGASNYLKEDNILFYELDRTRTIMTIHFKHSDPEFAQQVTNQVTDMFIEKLLEYKHFQTRSILKTLDEQLKVAQVELNESEAELRRFRERNPNVFLTQGRESIITGLATSQTQVQNTEELLSNIRQMQDKLRNSMSEDAQQFVFLEMISFLGNQNVAAALLLSERYQTLINERDRLINENYNNEHPLLQNNNSQLTQTQNEISGRLIEYQKQLQNNLNTSQQNISEGQRTLHSLPRNELKLAELQRNRQIKENILSSIMVRYNEAKVTDAAVIPDAYIVDRARLPIVIPAGMMQNIIFAGVGFILGLLFGIFIFAAMAFMDKKIWTSQEVQDKIKLRVLALIPVIGKDNPEEEFKNNETIDPKLITSDYAPTLAGETFRKLRTVIDMQLDQKNKTLIVGSLFPGEGKSLISANLAIAFAQQKKRTVLIDGDLRRGVQHSTFAKNKTPGLTDLVIKKVDVNAPMITDYIQDTHIPNLFLIASGNQVPNPSELLGSPQMENIFKLLDTKFDRIIFDSPPFGLSPDLMVMARYSKNIVLVLRSQNTNLAQFKYNLDEFGNVRKNIVGLIVNGSEEVIKGKSYQYSYYKY